MWAGARDVVREGDHEDEQDERDPDHRDPLVDLPRERAAAHSLDQREEDVATVERQEREEVEQREGHAHESQQRQVPGEAVLELRVAGSHDPDRSGESCAGAAAEERGDSRARAGDDAPEVVDRRRSGPPYRIADELRRGPEAQNPMALTEDRVPRAERHPLAVAYDGQGDRPSLARADQMRDDGERPRRLTVHGDDAIAPAQPRARRGSPRLDRGDSGRRALRRAAARREDGEEDEERDHDVRDGPRSDHRDALPRGSAPVGVRRRPLLDVPQCPLRRASRRAREVCGSDLLLELRIRSAGRVVVLRGERTSHRERGRRDRRLLLHRRLEENLQISRRGTVHARDTHEPAERDHADPVLDPAVPDLREGRREADVEAPRPHPDGERDAEVTELVEEDEQDEATDDDDPGHAAASAPVAVLRAAASASSRSSRSRTSAPVAAASVSRTTSGIARNGNRPSRNAATATSFAAL